MNTLSDIAIAAFKAGSDNYGESVTGVSAETEFQDAAVTTN